MMSDMIYSSVVQLAKAIKAKEISSVEVVQAYLKRIEDGEPETQCGCTVTRLMKPLTKHDQPMKRWRVVKVTDFCMVFR